MQLALPLLDTAGWWSGWWSFEKFLNQWLIFAGPFLHKALESNTVDSSYPVTTSSMGVIGTQHINGLMKAYTLDSIWRENGEVSAHYQDNTASTLIQNTTAIRTITRQLMTIDALKEWSVIGDFSFFTFGYSTSGSWNLLTFQSKYEVFEIDSAGTLTTIFSGAFVSQPLWVVNWPKKCHLNGSATPHTIVGTDKRLLIRLTINVQTNAATNFFQLVSAYGANSTGNPQSSPATLFISAK